MPPGGGVHSIGYDWQASRTRIKDQLFGVSTGPFGCVATFKNQQESDWLGRPGSAFRSRLMTCAGFSLFRAAIVPSLSMSRPVRILKLDSVSFLGGSSVFARDRARPSLYVPVRPPWHASRPRRARPRSLGGASVLQTRRAETRRNSASKGAFTGTEDRPMGRAEGLRRSGRDRRPYGGGSGGLEERARGNQGAVASPRSRRAPSWSGT